MTSNDMPKVLYGACARESTLPVRNAGAIVVENDCGQVLVVRRSASLAEFPRMWSFPSVYEVEGMTMWARLICMSREQLGLEVGDGRLVARRMGLRADWRILMHVFETRRILGPDQFREKYDEYRWVDVIEFLGTLDRTRLGECMEAYCGFLNI